MSEKRYCCCASTDCETNGGAELWAIISRSNSNSNSMDPAAVGRSGLFHTCIPNRDFLLWMTRASVHTSQCDSPYDTSSRDCRKVILNVDIALSHM